MVLHENPWRSGLGNIPLLPGHRSTPAHGLPYETKKRLILDLHQSKFNQ